MFLILVYSAWQRFLCISSSDKKKPLPGRVYHSSTSAQNLGRENIKIIGRMMASAHACSTENLAEVSF